MDGGANWTEVFAGSLSTLSRPSALALDPSAPDTLYTSVTGFLPPARPEKPADGLGLYRTDDGGAHWTLVNSDALGDDFLVHPTNHTLYVFGGPGSYISRSSNQGVTFTLSFAGLPARPVESLAFGAAGSNVFYSALGPDGVFKSGDAGGRWSSANAGLITTSVEALALDPSSGRLYAGTAGSGVFEGLAGGSWWHETRNGIVNNTGNGLGYFDARAIAIDPVESLPGLRRGCPGEGVAGSSLSHDGRRCLLDSRGPRRSERSGDRPLESIQDLRGQQRGGQPRCSAKHRWGKQLDSAPDGTVRRRIGPLPGDRSGTSLDRLCRRVAHVHRGRSGLDQEPGRRRQLEPGDGGNRRRRRLRPGRKPLQPLDRLRRDRPRCLQEHQQRRELACRQQRSGEHDSCFGTFCRSGGGRNGLCRHLGSRCPANDRRREFLGPLQRRAGEPHSARARDRRDWLPSLRRNGGSRRLLVPDPAGPVGWRGSTRRPGRPRGARRQRSSGAGSSPGATVRIGGIAATDVVVADGSRITLRTPALPSGSLE